MEEEIQPTPRRRPRRSGPPKKRRRLRRTLANPPLRPSMSPVLTDLGFLTPSLRTGGAASDGASDPYLRAESPSYDLAKFVVQFGNGARWTTQLSAKSTLEIPLSSASNPQESSVEFVVSKEAFGALVIAGLISVAVVGVVYLLSAAFENEG